MRLPAGFAALSVMALTMLSANLSAAEMRGVTAAEIRIG